jgi:hypothetical protein
MPPEGFNQAHSGLYLWDGPGEVAEQGLPWPWVGRKHHASLTEEAGQLGTFSAEQFKEQSRFVGNSV